jgi:predicted transposase YbfD/YdcC
LVAQQPVDEKSNEITALRPMLAEVPLEGVVLTADAMHAQQHAARFIQQEKGGEYFFTLKGNQPSIQHKAKRLLRGAFPPSTPCPGPH